MGFFKSRLKMQSCLICGDYNVSAGFGGVTSDGKVLCGLCFTMAEFGMDFKIKNYTASDLIALFKKNKIFFQPTEEIVTDIVWGVKQTIVQFDDERKLWRMVPFGEDGFRREAWLYRYSDIIDFELVQYGKYESTCDRLKIKITINERDGDSVFITFIESPYEIKKETNKYRRILASSKRCMDLLQNIKSAGTISESV